MTFASPLALLGLLLVPLLAGVHLLAQRRRRKFSLRYSSVALVRQATGRGHAFRRHLPLAFYLLAVAVLAIALARPSATIATPESSGTVMLSIDISGSMRSTDVKPTRLEAAKAAVRDFVNAEPAGVKIGLVAFSDSAFLITPPTEDRQQLLKAVEVLQVQRGTNIGDGLLTALSAMAPQPTNGDSASSDPSSTTPGPVVPPANPRTDAIVLLSDGASNRGPPPLQVADEVAQAGVRTYTVGLGTVQGGSFPGGGSFGGRGRFMQLDETTLKGIADRTGGRYFSAQSADQLHRIYGELARQELVVGKKKEVTFLAAGVGALLMLVGGALALVWQNWLP